MFIREIEYPSSSTNSWVSPCHPIKESPWEGFVNILCHYISDFNPLLFPREVGENCNPLCCDGGWIHINILKNDFVPSDPNAPCNDKGQCFKWLGAPIWKQWLESLFKRVPLPVNHVAHKSQCFLLGALCEREIHKQMENSFKAILTKVASAWPFKPSFL